MAAARALRAPLMFQTVIALYLGSLAVYAVFRLPWMYRVLMRQTPRWRRLKRRRKELEEEVADATRHRPPKPERR